MHSFKEMLHSNGYTAETFTKTYNNVYPASPISLSTIQSLSAGRRTFRKTSAIIVQRIAHILDDPDSPPFDYERRINIIRILLNEIN